MNVYRVSSVKFVLVISLCSFINNQCFPPVEIKQLYNSWKECTIAALELSKEILTTKSLKDNVINKYKFATKFMCNEVGEI